MCQDQQQVLEGLRANSNQAVECLYRKVFPKFFSRVYHGDELQIADAEDLFQNALIKVFTKIIEGHEVKNIYGYLYTIAINEWRYWNKNNSNRKMEINADPTDRNNPFFNLTEETLIEFGLEEKTYFQILLDEDMKVNDLILFFCSASKKLEKCMELLKLYYADNLSDEEIAPMMGFTNVDSVRVKRFRCLNRIRHYIKSNKK